MARTTASNYTVPGFQYATVDADQFDRTDVAGLGQSVDTHDHTPGKGLPLGLAAVPDGSVTTVKIVDANVTTAKLADGSVTTVKLADANVTLAKMAAASVGTTQLVDASVTTVKIADANVTQAKLSTASVGTAQLVDGSVTTAKLAPNLSISGTLTVAGTISTSSNLTVSNVATVGQLYLTNSNTYLLNVGNAIRYAAAGVHSFESSAGGYQSVNTGPLSVSGTLTTGSTIQANAGGIYAPNGWIAAGPIVSGSAGDLTANRNNGTGYLFLANGSHYVGFDGSNYQMPTSPLYIAGHRAVTEDETETLSNKTLVNPKESGPAAFVANGNDLTNYAFNYYSSTMTLPNPSAAYAGVFRAVRAWGADVTINCGTATLIPPGQYGTVTASFTLRNGDSITFWCDGINWWAL